MGWTLLDLGRGALMSWDRLFGTYQPETVPVVYGVTKGRARARAPAARRG
jgi:hypothetical protein